jgi:2-dehydro-3-deoxyphosphogluconate aldolase/(4S)-4-hydroxy-2-oxoglutarate aldolase
MKRIFFQKLFMPTGGVDTTRENIEGWFQAGVSAVGIGSKLISTQLMTDKDYTAIESETKKILDLILTIKNK